MGGGREGVQEGAATHGRSWAERLLACTGDEPPAVAASKRRSFQRFLLLLVAAESWHALHYPAYRGDLPLHLAIAGCLSVCALAGQWPRWERTAGSIALLAMVADLASVFPENANHQYVGIVAMGFCLLPGRDEDARASVQALRFVVPIGFFWAGFQKLFWGYWFGGEFLAVRVATDASFAMVLEPFLSGDEYARLASLSPGRGAGPFRVDEPLFLALSNGAWLAELALAPLLLLHRTRRAAAVGVVLFMLAIETAARELFFGMLMVSLALLYAPSDWNRAALPGLALLTGLLLAVSAGWLPGFSFG